MFYVYTRTYQHRTRNLSNVINVTAKKVLFNEKIPNLVDFDH